MVLGTRRLASQVHLTMLIAMAIRALAFACVELLPGLLSEWCTAGFDWKNVGSYIRIRGRKVCGTVSNR